MSTDDPSIPFAIASETPTDEPVAETKIAFTGDRATAQVVAMMLDARGISNELGGEHQVETGTLVATVRVHASQYEDAVALVIDFESGAAARKG